MGGLDRNFPTNTSTGKNKLLIQYLRHYFGKYGKSSLWQKENDRINLTIDVLADSTNLRWVPNLSGFIKNNTDFRRLTINYMFDEVSDKSILADNISRMSFNIESKGRGRNLNRILHTDNPIYVDTYTEVYFIDKKYISVADARNLEKHPKVYDKSTYLDSSSTFIPPLQPSIKDMVIRVNNIDRTSLRINKKPDTRYIAKRHTHKKKKKGILDTLKSLFE